MKQTSLFKIEKKIILLQILEQIKLIKIKQTNFKNIRYIFF